MDNPKISILIPLYNRKHYIAQCIDSALNQTFKEDYEIIIRDNCSTDGGFEFVAEKYAKEISTGKIRLYKNQENLGEIKNTRELFHDAKGKYIGVLHSDDMYLPHTLQHLYEVAEKTNADVVHESFRLDSPKNGIINSINDCKPCRAELNTFKEVTIMSKDPNLRFREWLGGGTFTDLQYNLLKRTFVLKDESFFEYSVHLSYALWWMMTAEVFVKTPVICYINRDAPDNQSHENLSPQKMVEIIVRLMELINHMDKLFPKVKFFKDNEYAQYIAKSHMLETIENFYINRNKIYANGITPELYNAVADTFKKYFGHDYFFPMAWFNWTRVAPFNHRADIINFNANPPYPPPSR